MKLSSANLKQIKNLLKPWEGWSGPDIWELIEPLDIDYETDQGHTNLLKCLALYISMQNIYERNAIRSSPAYSGDIESIRLIITKDIMKNSKAMFDALTNIARLEKFPPGKYDLSSVKVLDGTGMSADNFNLSEENFPTLKKALAVFTAPELQQEAKKEAEKPRSPVTTASHAAFSYSNPSQETALLMRDHYDDRDRRCGCKCNIL